MRTMKKQFRHLIIAICLMFLVVGFAAFSTTLKINGTYNISSMSWDVHFENVQVTEGSVNASVAPTTNNVDTTEMTYTIDFTKPGDFYEFTVDIVNDGSLDAMVDVVSNNAYQNASSTTPITLPSYLTSIVTYVDGRKIAQNQLLSKETSEKIKVRVEFKKDIASSDLPSDGDTSIVFKFIGDFKQADKNACPKATTFEDDSWDIIQCNVKNNPQSYVVGSTKTIEMDLDNDNINETYTLRVANNTIPEECSTTGFSQTACGFVVEFQDVISKHRMNPNGDVVGTSTLGGWEYSDMRAYLNSTTYAYENIDYSSTGIYNSLPSDLKKIIINTVVVSGHNNSDTTNFTTIDKLYLLGMTEIYSDNPMNLDTASNLTRQLDFYSEKNISSGSHALYPGKKYNGTESSVWIRNPRSDGLISLYLFNGSWLHGQSNEENGVSPAFRIG